MKTKAVQRHADNGECSHTEMINIETGESLCCGNCNMFENEDAGGDGLCLLYLDFTHCGSWCEYHNDESSKK